MSKLRLSISDLKVETFSISEKKEEKGTVVGNGVETAFECEENTQFYTCYACGATELGGAQDTECCSASTCHTGEMGCTDDVYDICKNTFVYPDTCAC